MALKTVAIIGCGIGRAHLAEAYAAMPGKFRVIALCDLDTDRLARVGDEFGVARRTTTFEAVLGMDDVDIVDICTPPTLHVPQILAALAAGKHVVCEKPLAGSLAEIDAVTAAERGACGRVMPIFQYRYGDGVQRAKHIIDAGLAGKPYLATVETAWKRGAAYYAIPWRGRWESELGGALVAHAIHAHDLLTWLMGPVERVFGRTAIRVNPIQVEDCAVASLLLRSGALASLAVTLGSQKEITRLRLCFENVTFESSLEPYAPGDEPWQILPASSEAEAQIAMALADWVPIRRRFGGQLERWHDALEGNGALPVTLGEARQSLELATALYHSAETGTDVHLPLGPEHPKYHGWQPGRAEAHTPADVGEASE